MIVYEYWWYDFMDCVWVQCTAAQHSDMLMVAAITGGDCKYAIKEVQYNE